MEWSVLLRGLATPRGKALSASRQSHRTKVRPPGSFNGWLFADPAGWRWQIETFGWPQAASHRRDGPAVNLQVARLPGAARRTHKWRSYPIQPLGAPSSFAIPLQLVDDSMTPAAGPCGGLARQRGNAPKRAGQSCVSAVLGCHDLGRHMYPWERRAPFCQSL